MHKCFKCGAEFDGKFCPECGTQWQENKHCPNCGAMLAGGAKFCNNCGYSFVGKKEPSKVGAFFKKVWLWIKRHAKVVIPTACALIVVIVVCSLIPTFILMGVNGTYYGYTFDENGEIIFNEKNFVTLSTGKWTDSDGNEGTYSRSGKNVTLKYHDQAAEDLGDMFGAEVPTEVELAATVENGLLIISDGVREEIYAKQSHKHFGEWEITEAPTCTENGEQKRVCACKAVETETIRATGHKVSAGKCDVCGLEEITYTLIQNDTAYEVSRFNTEIARKTDVVILSEYEGKPVTSIRMNAFLNCSGLTSITIPDSVTNIEEYAFQGCSQLIQTESGAQYVDKWIIDCDTSITSVTLRSNTVGIGNSAFYNCSGLTSITIPDSVTSIGREAFYGCNGLTNVIIPDSVTSIGNSAFQYCSSLTSITIPDSVTSIGEEAFILCNGLTNVMIGNSVTSIGNSAFQYCSSLTSITIPDSVTSIGEYAFHGCGLTSITIPDGVTSIESWAFTGCGLTSITIPDGVTSIGWNAFACTSLTSITIPDSVTNIGDSAFYGCTSLTSIVFKGKMAQWNAIKKRDWWNRDTGNYTVQCTDGKLDKNGNEIA